MMTYEKPIASIYELNADVIATSGDDAPAKDPDELETDWED